MYFFKAVMLTGGGPSSALRTGEVYVPATNSTCSLPNFSSDTWAHSQDGLLQCGGSPTPTKCHTLKDGKWIVSHTLKRARSWHVSWTPKDGSGTYLLGGYAKGSQNNSAFVKRDGTEVPAFPLKYNTW